MYGLALRSTLPPSPRGFFVKKSKAPSLRQEMDSSRDSRRSRRRLWAVRSDPSPADPMRSPAPSFAMSSRPPVDREPVQSGASAPAASRRFVTPGLRARRSFAAVAPSIDAAMSIDGTSASVTTAAYWGTTSPHPVADGRIPSPTAGARIPCTVDAQISAAACWACYGSPSPAADVHGSFVDLLRR
jgi:hypothetical protein